MIEFETIQKSVGETTYRLCVRLPEMGRPKVAFQILRINSGKEVWHTVPRSWRNIYEELQNIFASELSGYKLI